MNGRRGDAPTSGLALLWLAGLSLRITVLAVPPLLTAIHNALGLDEKAVGMLTALPVLLLAGASVLGSLVTHRLGPRGAVMVGLGIVALAGAARGLGPSIAVLFGMTFAMGCGIAICQPALPSLVAAWFPNRVGFATAAYSNGLVVAEALAAGLTLPLILPLVGGGWPLGLAFWSLVVAGAVAGMATFNPPGSRPPAAPQARWLPDWRDPQTWRLGLLQGMGALPFWVPNAFLPDFLHAAGRSDLIAVSLTTLSFAQLPASLVVAGFARYVVQKRWPLVVSGVLMFAAAAALMAGPIGLAPVWSGVLGFTSGVFFMLNLALPPLLAPHDAHRLSAGIFSISYTLVFVAPLIGGALWDATSVGATGFAPVLLGSAAVVAIAWRIDLTRGSTRQAQPVAAR